MLSKSLAIPLLLLLAACASDELPGLIDADTTDTERPELGSEDTDSGTPEDTAVADTTPDDTAVADTTPDDTAAPDTAPDDTAIADTTPDDTAVADTGPDDTAIADTTPDAPADRCDTGIRVTVSIDQVAADGACSLREAVLTASGRPANGDCAAGSEVGLVTLPLGTYDLTIAGAGEDLGLTGDLDIAGSVAVLGCPRAIIAATGQDRIFDLPATAALELNNLELSGGLVTGEGGGAIRANGTFDGTDLTFRNNQANGGDGANGSNPGGGGGGGGGAGLGGAIFSDHGTVRLNAVTTGSCIFLANTAAGGRGGAGPVNGGAFEGPGGNGGGATGGAGGPAATVGGTGGFGGGGGGGGSTSSTAGSGGIGGYGGGGGGGGADTGGGDAGAGAPGGYAGGTGGTGCCSAGSGGGGGAGLGGAIFFYAGGAITGGAMEINGCIFDSNAATGGNPGGNAYGGPAATVGSGFGGAIFAESWTPILGAPTFSNNTASTTGTDLYSR